MPNWVEGTMKLRGRCENVERFLKEAVAPLGYDVLDEEGRIEFESTSACFSATIFGTHYLKEKGFWALIDGGYDIFSTEKSITACLRVRFAWSFVRDTDGEDGIDKWKKLSKKYDLDFRLYGFERGGQFAQELIVERGKEPILKEWGYKDWEWDCPFPYMGG